MEEDNSKFLNVESFDLPWQQIRTALIRSDQLTPNEWRLYCVLKTFSGCKQIFPSYGTLERLSNMSRNTIIRSLEKLEFLQLLEKEHRADNNKKNTSCLFTLRDYMRWAKAKRLKIEDSESDVDQATLIKYIPTGYISVQNRLICCPLLTSVELRLFCVLLTFHYKGSINPSISKLANYCGVGERTVYTTISNLEEKKLIKRQGRFDPEPNGAGVMSNEYIVYNYIEWLDKSEG